MAYKRAETNSFAQYQLGEGFGAAVNGKIQNGSNAGDLSTKAAARVAQKSYDRMPKDLKGYEGYPSYYAGFSDDLTTTQASSLLMKNTKQIPGGLEGDLSTRQVARTALSSAKAQGYGLGEDLSTRQAARTVLSAAKAQGYHGIGEQDLSTRQVAGKALSAAKAQGYQGYHGYETYQGIDLNTQQVASKLLSSAKAQGYEGYGLSGVEDDAFAGYNQLGQALSLKQASDIARENKLPDDVDEFSGLGELGQQDLESWHTFFNRAALAKTDTDLLLALKRAVKAVPDDTPATVKRSYYEMAIRMLRMRKNTDLRYLDVERMEIESNLGWLVNPNIPKTGGFTATLKKVVGAVGAKLGKNDKDDLRMMKNMELGRLLKEELRKTGELGDWAANTKLVYVGLGVLGLGAAWYYLKKRKAPTFAKKKKK